MRRVFLSLLVVVAIVGALLVGCGPAAAPTPEPKPTVAVKPTAVPPTAIPPTAVPTKMAQTLSLAGSTTVQPLAEKLAAAYMAKNPGVEITIQGGGSSVGVKSAGDGTVDIGTASREVKASELKEYPDLKVFTIARDGIAVVVNAAVPVNGITKEQARDIFAGNITNWSEVGGPNRAIVVVSREEGSGTRAAFEELVMGAEGPSISEMALLQPSNGAVRTTVSTTPDSVGYLSFGYLDASVKALAVEGVESTVENALSGDYPVVRPLNMLTKGEPTGLAKSFLSFVLDSEGQRIVVHEGYLSVR